MKLRHNFWHQDDTFFITGAIAILLTGADETNPNASLLQVENALVIGKLLQHLNTNGVMSDHDILSILGCKFTKVEE